MNVILRCPNCGTTQLNAGECEACHEAQVRYFCTNHEPGIWLSGATCPQCAARAAVTARSEAPPRTRPGLAAVTAPPRPRSVSPASSSSSDKRRGDDAATDVRVEPLWQKLLRAAVLSRRSAVTEARHYSLPQARSWLMRLVLRIVVICIILIVAAAGAIYWLASSLD